MKQPKNGAPSPGGDLATPGGLLRELIARYPKLATLILGGLGVLAAATIFSGWHIDIKVAAEIGFWILGLGFLLGIVSFVVSNRRLKLVLGWFLTCFLMVIMSLMLVSAAFPGQTSLPPIYCMVRPWEYCGTVGKSIAQTLPGTEEPLKMAVVDGGRITSFMIQLEAPEYAEKGLRYWSWQNDYWEERYPSGKIDRFINPGRLILDDCPGTTVARSTNGDLIFIPDKGCRAMLVRWRTGSGSWNYLGQMRDIN